MTETIRALPAGWTVSTLKRLGTWSGGGTPNKSNDAFWQNGSVPWVSPKDMKTDFISSAEDKITEAALDQSAAKRIASGSVLLVTRSGILRHTLPVAVTRVETAVNQDLKALTPREGVDATFVLRFVQAFNREILHACSKDGTTVQSIETERLLNYPVHLPPLDEQRRIVDAIDELFSDLDAGEAALRDARRKLDRYRQSVLNAAVTGALTEAWREAHPDAEPASVLLDRILEERRRQWETDTSAKYTAKGIRPPKNWRDRYTTPAEPEVAGLTPLPASWTWATVDQLSWESQYGTSVKCSYEAAGPPVLRIPNVRNGGVDLADLKRATAESLDKSLAPLVPADWLVIRTNGSRSLIGRSALVRQPLSAPHFFASYLIRFRLLALGDLPEWVNMVWAAPTYRETIESAAATSAGQYNISQSAISRFALPLPPTAEQAAIVEEVERRLSVADAVAADVDAQLARSKRLRRSILQRAFEGRLVPQSAPVPEKPPLPSAFPGHQTTLAL